MKSLSEMTVEELWELFPIVISPYNPQWLDDYRTEKDIIVNCAGVNNVARISHIGSTAVPGLTAKPTVDILLEIHDDTDTDALKHALERNGYIFERQPNKPAPHMMFMKGYTQTGFAEKVYHLHVRYLGDWDEFYFRDYLVSHPSEAQRYGELKKELKEKYEHDRDGYTAAKSEFIAEAVRKSRKESIVDYGVR